MQPKSEHNIVQFDFTSLHKYPQLGGLVAIDGSLIDSVLSMAWADYRKATKKAKLHLGFNINHAIPPKLFLTEGKGDERPFVPLCFHRP